MALTDAKLRALKGRADPYKISDSEGLHVLVSPGGTKLWRLAYRYSAKQKTLALGKYPTVSLLEARRARDAAKKLLQQGTDPSADRKAQRRLKVATGCNTFKVVANEWFAGNRNLWVESYSGRLKSRMDEDLLPDLGDQPIGEIAPPAVLKAIRQIEERGAIEMAKRVMQMASAIFRYGVATGRCSRDPTADLKGALKPAGPIKHRTALPVAELPALLGKLTEYDGDQTTRFALSLIMLTFVRTSELRFARWTEFEDLDGDNPLWRIPPDRMKMRRGHLVPLVPQALKILRDLHKLTGKSPYLFPATTKTGVISENTLIFALYRMGYHGRATVHGFRSTASTVLNENHFNRDWIEMQLAHFDGTVRGVYNAAEWLPSRRQMMSWWADYLDVAVRPAAATP